MSKNIEAKKVVVSEIEEKIEKAQSIVIVEYKALTVEQATALRAKCRANGVDYCVLKNTLFKRALANKGIAMDGMGLKVVTIGENGVTEDDILVHDAHCDNVGVHMLLADMKYPDFPVALGVIRDVKAVTYDDGVRDQVTDQKAKSKIQCVDDLLRSGSTWEVK